MSRLSERVLLSDGALLCAALDFPLYRLSWRKGAAMVVYENAGEGHHRQVCGRVTAYAFRSVEQMRYDFERDIERSGGALGPYA